MLDARAPMAAWHSVRDMPHFWRLLQVRVASQFGDGLFQAGLAGAILFNPERAAQPWAIAVAFAVLFLPYSLVGPFAGALLDRWDRRVVLIVANLARLALVLAVAGLLAAGAGALAILFGALIVNGFTRFVSSGLSAALPHVVPRERVVPMNAVAAATGAVAAFVGANFMLLPRWLFGADDSGSATIILLVLAPVAVAVLLSARFPSRVLGPDDTAAAVHGSAIYAVITGWLHGARTVVAVPTVTATLSGLAAHRMAFGVNTLVVLVIVRHGDGGADTVAGLELAVLFVAATGLGSFLATVATPKLVARWGRYRAANGALTFAMLIQLVAATLHMPTMVACGFLLGACGQVVKLCADAAMQVDVDDPLRGHVFTVQDSLFWVSFVGAVAVAAALVPADGHAPGLALAGAVLYLAGLAGHGGIARRARS